MILYLAIAGSCAEQKANDTFYTLSELSYNAVANAGTVVVTELVITPSQMIISTEPGSSEKLLAYAFDDSSLPNFGSLEDELAVGNQNPRGLTFGDNGDFLYISGNASPYLQRRELSTAYDITTAGTTTTFNTQSFGWGGQGLAFKSDGSILFAAEGNNIRVCNLNTNWDITSISGTPSTVALSGINDDDGDSISSLFGVRFKPDGTKFFVCYRVDNTPKVAEFSLSTAWDLSTKSFVSSLNIGDKLGYYSSGVLGYPAGLDWNSNGSRLYLSSIHVELTIGQIQVAEYTV